MSNNLELAAAFFTASGAGDADGLTAFCAPDFVGTQNGGPDMNLKSLVWLATTVKKALPDFRYENAVRSETSTGFVEEHDVCATLPDGKALRIPICVVADVSDGKVTAMREYFDSAAAAPLMAALSGQA